MSTNCKEIEPTPWQTMETAPRDEDILVAYDVAGTWVVHLAFWLDYEDWMVGIPEYDEDDEGWWSYIQGSVSRMKLEGIHEPMLWMRCPEIPRGDHTGFREALDYDWRPPRTVTIAERGQQGAKE